MIDIKNFPINSTVRVYRKVDIQVDPFNRTKGEKRYYKDWAYFKGKVTHHVKFKDDFWVGVEGDNSNEGYVLCLRQFKDREYIVLANKYFRFLLKNRISDDWVKKVVDNTRHKLNNRYHNRVYHPNSRSVGRRRK